VQVVLYCPTNIGNYRAISSKSKYSTSKLVDGCPLFLPCIMLASHEVSRCSTLNLSFEKRFCNSFHI